LSAELLARLRGDRVAVLAAAILLSLVVLAAAADPLAEHVFHANATRQDLLSSYTRPTWSAPAYWLGSDDLGRSQIVRLLYGARVSLAVGFGAACINLSLGLLLGLTAGFVQGWFDDLVQFVIGTLNSIPQLPLLLIVAVLFEPGPVALVLILGVLLWPNATLFVRGQTLSLREREFIDASRSLGARATYILRKDLLPNLIAPILVYATLLIPTNILFEAALSYLGVGVQAPRATWGGMLSDAATWYQIDPWFMIPAGMAIFVTVLAFNLFGDGLRDALDPRSR
jgi:ABC-type dipeptide/oligopeptide/nickel transport system permease subunit